MRYLTEANAAALPRFPADESPWKVTRAFAQPILYRRI